MPQDGSLSGVFAGVLWALFGIATVTDLMRGKIYNTLTFSFLVAGFGARLYISGWGGGREALFSFFISFLLYFPLWRLKVLAAGDVKLLMAASPWLATPELIRLAVLSILVGAVVGLVVRLEKSFRQRNIKTESAAPKLLRMPFAPAFLCAFILMQIAQMNHTGVAGRFLGSITPW